MKYCLAFFSIVVFVACAQKSKVAKSESKAPVAATSTPAPTSPPKTSPPSKSTVGNSELVSCSSGSEERMLQVKVVGDGCELLYTKNGQENKIASANNGQGYCKERSDKIVKTLEGAGYQCK